ncbi:MAG: hypothetical protein IJR93_03115 [Treponema sp.]|nr:hypothetical protein [Treponema sp.]
MYAIHLGIPEMKDFWDSLRKKVKVGKATKVEQSLYQKFGKTMKLLSINPRHTGLHMHDIESLTKRYGMKVWESYLENNKPAAGRVFWVYAPNQNDITIIGLEPHPNTKKDSYKKITLSAVDGQ